jgi:Mg2+ and Co2+ transporter CorA
MPELEWQLGYPFVLRLMATIAVVMLFTSENNDECTKQNARSEK